MSWWNYLICFVCYFIGKLQASYSIIIPMICVNFALPFTKEIEQYTGVSTTKVRKKIKKTIMFWAIVNSVAFLLLIMFVPYAYFLAYAIGALLIIFKIGQTKKNQANVSDYYIAYIDTFPTEHKDRVDSFFRDAGYIQ